MKLNRLLGTIIVGGALMTGSFVAGAQTREATAEQPTHRDPAKMMQHRLDKMKSKLDLTDAQTAQIKAILEQNRTQMEAQHKQMQAQHQAGVRPDSTQRAAFHAQMKANRDAVDAQIKAVLNPAQQAKWTEFEAKREKHGEGKRGEKDRD